MLNQGWIWPSDSEGWASGHRSSAFISSSSYVVTGSHNATIVLLPSSLINCSIWFSWFGLCLSCFARDSLTLIFSTEHWPRFFVQDQMLHHLNQDSLLNDHNSHNRLSLLLSSCWMGFWGASGLFPARSENVAETSGTCNTFHGLPGEKLCQLKLLTDYLGLWATSSMSLPGSLVIVLHGQGHAQSHFQLFWDAKSHFHVPLAYWHIFALLSHRTLSTLVVTS